MQNQLSVISTTGGLSGIKSLGDLLATFALAGSTASIGASVAGFTALLAVVGAINQNLKELDQNTSNAFQTWSQSNDSFETQIDQINKLKASLESGTLSEQEAYNAKSQLYDIQRQIISSYGDDVAGIDLINGKIEGRLAY